MKSLTKANLAARDALCTRLIHTHGDLEDALIAYNDAMAAQWDKLVVALDGYNAVVDEANTWVEEIAAEIQEEIDSHHEKWQDSDRGQAYVAWQRAYESETLERSELEQPAALELDLSDQSEGLEALPEDPQ